MHILIIEARLSGHHPVYLERIATGLANAGHNLTLAFSSQDTDNFYINYIRQRFSNLVTIHLIDDRRISAALTSRMGIAGREIAIRRLFAETFRQVDIGHKVDHVLLPYLDYCLYAIALLGPPFNDTQWSAISMRPAFHYLYSDVIAPKPKYAAIKELLFFRLLSDRTLKRLLTIDEPLHDYVVMRRPDLCSRISYLPDPAEMHGSHTYESARSKLNIKDEQKVILVYGAIDARKGLEELLAALDDQSMPEHIALLIVGKQSNWAKSHLSGDIGQRLKAQGRLYELDSFVDDDTQQMVFSAADLVWLGYKYHYAMSGVLILAALAKKTVVSTNEGLIGWYTRKYNLGFDFDSNELKAVLTKAFTLAAPEKAIDLNFPNHSWSNAHRIIRSCIS